MKFQTTAFLLLVVAFFACKSGSDSTPKPVVVRDTSINPTNAFTELFLDSAGLETFILREKIHDSMATRLRDFYKSRNYQYAWFFIDGVADYTRTFLHLQNEYMGYARDSSIYNPALAGLETALADTTPYRPDDTTRLFNELQLTRQFFRYAREAYSGRRDINTKDLNWFIPRKKINMIGLLDSMLQHKGENLSQYEPVNRQYNLLKEYLLKYYEIEKGDGWTPIEAGKKSLREGDSSITVAQLKKRLRLYGDYVEDDSSRIFTPELTNAIKGYQHRYGLKEDGVAGPALIREMNEPVENRIQQILINMERMRWVPAQPTGDFLLVNIPEFRLHVYEDGVYKWNMGVVVGTAAHSTVIFNGDLKYIVFSPYWNVPPGILKNEVLPGIRKNPNYLARHNMEWNGGAVRQKPGPSNSLGLVKFLFPNSYNIYLHDTPSKNLFNESKRAFSHGCIRLSEPKKLAEYLLRDDSTWTSDKITRAMKSGKEKYVTLKQTIPVFIGYFTAWVDRDGKLNFRDDIYGHDAKMARQLFAKGK